MDSETDKALDGGKQGIGSAFSKVRSWLQAAPDHVALTDLLQLGPQGVFDVVKRFATKPHGRFLQDSETLDARDPEFVKWVIEAVRAVGETYFRADVDGLNHVPEAGPVLFVGNHNGGIVSSDAMLSVSALTAKFGFHKPLYLLTHDLVWSHPVGRRLGSKFGLLRASHKAAIRVLQRGEMVIVYPGSDLDSWRPWSQRHRIKLGGRLGFIKVALQTRAPIVPIVSVGTHEQMLVLSTGKTIARVFDLKKHLRTEAFPIVLAMPWGITSGYLPYWPLPAQTSVRFGAPIVWTQYGPDEVSNVEVLQRCYDEVERAMQMMLDELSDGRIPLLGKVERAATSPWTRRLARVTGRNR